MATEFVMPFARANPSDFREIGAKINSSSESYRKAILERLGQFFEGFRGESFDDDSIYGVACDLTSAKVWSAIRPTELAPVISRANKGAKKSFLDGVPHEYRVELEKTLAAMSKEKRLIEKAAIKGAVIRGMKARKGFKPRKTYRSVLGEVVVHPVYGIIEGAKEDLMISNLVTHVPDDTLGMNLDLDLASVAAFRGVTSSDHKTSGPRGRRPRTTAK